MQQQKRSDDALLLLFRSRQKDLRVLSIIMYPLLCDRIAVH